MNLTVDWDTALASVNQDRRLLKLVIDAFLREAPGLQEQIVAAIRDNDVRTLQRCGHTLKGTMQSLGAEPWSDMARRLEELGAGGSTEGARELAEELGRQLPSLFEQLSRFSADGDVPS